MSADTAAYKPDLVDGDQQTIERVIALFCREFGLATYAHTSIRAIVGSLHQILVSASMRPMPAAEPTLIEALDGAKPPTSKPRVEVSVSDPREDDELVGVSEPGAKHPRFEVKAPQQQALFEIDPALLEAPMANDILQVCGELAKMLMRKNKAYGNSAVEPLRVFSKADPVEQIKVRMDDKLSRLVRGQAAGEDALLDLVGYWVLLQIAVRKLELLGTAGSNGRPAS